MLSDFSKVASAPNLFAHNSLRERPETAVICLLDAVGETAGRQLLHTTVIFDAFAAPSFAGAGFIGAVTFFQVLLFAAVHKDLS
jgi:hypothetical protein